jgi:hypothetical protein
LTKAAPKAQSLCFSTPSDEEALITLELGVGGASSPIRALVDCGASNNFIRRQSLDELSVPYTEVEIPPTRMTVRLATGASVKVMKRVVGLHYTLEGEEYDDEFIVLDLDDKFDVILGLPWLRLYDPQISWRDRSVKISATRASGGHLMSVLSRPRARGCVEGECDGLTRHSVVSTTAQDVVEGQAFDVEKAAGGCAETQAAPKTSHESESHESSSTCEPSGPHSVKTPRANKSHESSKRCLPKGQHHDESKSTSAVRRQRRRSRSIGESNEEDLAAVAPLQLEDPACIRPQDVTETLNVLVNDGTRVGASTLELVAPPKSASEITTLPTLEPKRFLRDLRRGKVTQICVLVADDEYVTDIRSAVVFAENERLLSTSSMDESVLDEKTRIERFTSQSWESLKSNPLYEDLVEFKDVFPESVPCELPKDKGIRHEIDLKPGTKYCIMRQWPLPREQVEAIDKFFADRLAAGHVRESKSPHSSPTFCVRKATGGWRIVHAFNKLNAATIPAQTPIPRKE